MPLRQGCGQMLSVSRRTATFFNKETGLQPDLVVVSPLRRAIQSAMISFPTYTAQTSLLNTPWICHPMCMEQANGNKSEFVSSTKVLNELFPGVDYSLFEKCLVDGNAQELNGREKVSLLESKLDLMGRTDEFLRWIKEREERVIVGKWGPILLMETSNPVHGCSLNCLFLLSSSSTQCQATQPGCILYVPSHFNTNLKVRVLRCSKKAR